MHIAMFVAGSLGLCIGLNGLVADPRTPSSPSNTSRPWLWLEKARSKIYQYIGLIIGMTIWFPTVAAVILAAVLNKYDYLLLEQQHCYASYVSSRWGYINIYILEWTTKVTTWLGVNV
jgi:hypothetical protein